MIIGAINNEIIKILFDTNKEDLLIGDLVKITNDDNKGVIAQVFRIENSKKLPSNNVASAKILLTLKSDNSWCEWAGNIPSREYSVAKVKKEEISSYLNLKNTNEYVHLGYMPLYENIKVQADIAKFADPTLILSEKLEHRTNMRYALAQEFARNEIKVLMLDFAGEYSHITDVNKIKAGRNFKLPLDSRGIDSLYDRTLSNASAETRAIIEDVFMSVQDYIDSSQLGFIPFSQFKKVVTDEYEESQITELVLLKNKLTKLERQGVFANNKFETESIKMCLDNSNLTILDLSSIPSLWHKDFIDYLINSNIEKYNLEFFLIFEGDDINLDNDLINKIYISGYKRDIIPVISVDYNSGIVNSLRSHTKNYILYSQEFAHSNFQEFDSILTRLNSKEAFIFGEITNNIPLIIRTEENIDEEIAPTIAKTVEEEPEIPPANKVQKKYIEEYEEDDSFFNDISQEDDFEKYNPGYEIIDDSKQEDNKEEEPYISESAETADEEKPPLNDDYAFLNNDDTDENLDYEYTEEDLEEIQHYINTDNEEEYKEEPFTPDETSAKDPDEELESPLTEDPDEFISPLETQDIIDNKISSLDIPVYPTMDDEENTEEDFAFKEGDSVKHQKYGTGIIKKIISYGNKKLCSIQFEKVGRRLLDPNLAVIEKV